MSHNHGESQVTTRAGFLSPRLPILALLMVITSVPTGNCHIASVLGGSGGSDGRSPLSMSHIRLSRGPNVPTVPQTEEAESAALSRLHFLKPPTYQHKYLQRLSQFHGNERGFGNGNFPPFSTGEYNQGNWVENTPGEEPTPEEQDPTYMPYIGARAFSNIPKFFEHLRANIEALRANEDNNDQPGVAGPMWKDDSTERRAFPDERGFLPSEGGYQWNHQIRSFHHQPLDRPRHNNYNPSWQYTNLGLGRRR